MGNHSQRSPKKLPRSRKYLNRFIAIPHEVLDNKRYRSLSSTAVVLLLDLVRQHNGRNNGDLAAAQKTLSAKGWAESTRKRLLKNLTDQELITVTRQGGKNRCSLYALSWFPIEECDGKLDVASTAKPYIDFHGENERLKNCVV